MYKLKSSHYEKRDFLLFLTLNSFLISNILCIWLFWIFKYVFGYNVNWFLAFEINFILTVALAFLFNFFPEFLITIHTIWKKIKKTRFIVYIYSLNISKPKTMYVLLAGLVFSYCRLEAITIPNPWSLLGVFIAFLALARIFIVSSLLLFQLFVTNSFLEKIWVTNNLVKKKFFHSSRIHYGPFNSPQNPESAAKAIPALIGTLGGVLLADGANRGHTDKQTAHDNACAAAEKARDSYQRAQEALERYAKLAKNYQKKDSQEAEALINSTMRKEKIEVALEAQAQLKRAQKIASEQEEVANGVLDVVDHISTPQAAIRSYQTSGDICGARQLDSAASKNLTLIETIKREADQKLHQLEGDASISSVFESTFFDCFPVF